MSHINRKEISSNLFDFIFFIHHKLINPTEHMKKVSIPPSHAKVLFLLGHYGDKSITEAANQLHISKPNMTPIIDKLIMEEYVERFNDENDRRIIRIRLTEKGHIFLKEQMEIAKESIVRKLTCLDDSKCEQLDKSIRESKEILDKL